MIQISTRRFGPFVIAATSNDYHDITLAIGLTTSAASRRLCRSLQ